MSTSTLLADAGSVPVYVMVASIITAVGGALGGAKWLLSRSERRINTATAAAAEHGAEKSDLEVAEIAREVYKKLSGDVQETVERAERSARDAREEAQSEREVAAQMRAHLAAVQAQLAEAHAEIAARQADVQRMISAHQQERHDLKEQLAVAKMEMSVMRTQIGELQDALARSGAIERRIGKPDERMPAERVERRDDSTT